MDFFEKIQFDKINFDDKPFVCAEYSHCTFNSCDFTGVRLSGAVFSKCSFLSCNLSMTPFAGTSLQDVSFKDCKLTGTEFEHCNRFGLALSFENCIMDYASFYKLRMPKTQFRGCNLSEANLGECDLSQCDFDRSDLTRAIFINTKLDKADLRTAFNFAIDPSSNSLKKARFSHNGLAGLLGSFGIVIED